MGSSEAATFWPGPLAKRAILAHFSWCRRAVADEIRADFPNARRLDNPPTEFPAYFASKGPVDEQVRLALLVLDHRLDQERSVGGLVALDPERVKAGEAVVNDIRAFRQTATWRGPPPTRRPLKPKALLPIVRGVLDGNLGKPVEFHGKCEFDYLEPIGVDLLRTEILVGGFFDLSYHLCVENEQHGLLLRNVNLLGSFGWAGETWSPASEEETRRACETLLDFVEILKAPIPEIMARARSDMSPEELLYGAP